MDNNDLVGEFDAQVWAKRWLEIISENPNIPTDEGAMIGWFANAIMAGYDRGRANLEEAKEALRPFAEIAEAYNPDTWRAGPSPMYAILDECREAKRVFDKLGEDLAS